MKRAFSYYLALCVLLLVEAGAAPAQVPLQLTLRARDVDQQGKLVVEFRHEQWDPRKTAVIVCDMWDAHHCLNAVRRCVEMAPRMNAFIAAARERGATIIHAPSSCVDAYRDHPARQHVARVPRTSSPPTNIESWCYWKDSSEESTGYPIDHSDGGEDDDLEEHQRWADQLAARGRNPGSPWLRQIDSISIADQDYITDDGIENWSILEHHGIDNVMLVGVHTNMCVLGRPFGLRQLSRNGKHVVLVRDLTDTMYNPAMRPYVSHFSGTDLIAEHVEQNVCPTITSDQLLGGTPFRFHGDRRPHVAILIGEDEYETSRTLPQFAREQLYRDMKVSFVTASDAEPNQFPGIDLIREADLLLVSVRRRTLPVSQLQVVREFIDSGRPVVGIRTASHAFSPADPEGIPEGHMAWPEFDAEVWGGNYHGHHGNKMPSDPHSLVWGMSAATGEGGWPFSTTDERRTTSWLYKTSPLGPGTRVLMMGRVEGREPAEPVTWTNIHRGGGRAFYTSLGHPDDFRDESFPLLLRRGVEWALGL